MTIPAAPTAHRSYWGWMPAIVIAIAAVPNTIFIITAIRVHPTKVEAKAWDASARIDAARAGEAAFDASGRLFSARVEADALVAVIAGPPPGEGLRLRLYRPDDPQLDREIAWPAGAGNLAADLPKAGLWRVMLLGPAGRLAETQVNR
jgi:hypothetical protein